MSWLRLRKKILINLLDERAAPITPKSDLPRQNCLDRMARALERRENIALFGPPRQGKTTLLKTSITLKDNVYIECWDDISRTDLYRILLSCLGYSVSVEKKKKFKTGSKVKLSFFGANTEGDINLENERTSQEVSIDLENPSQVSHLVARVKKVPYVILNNFDRIDGSVKGEILRDISFFHEVSEIRFVIAGSWMREDYLEIVEPAISGKVTYVDVPFWDESELRQLDQTWTKDGSASPIREDYLKILLDLAHGDVSLFKTIRGVQENSSLAAYAEAASNIAIAKSMKWIETATKRLLRSRSLIVSFNVVRTELRDEINSLFKAIPDRPIADYKQIEINPETGRRYQNRRSVRVDDNGHPEFFEKRHAEFIKREVDIAFFLLEAFYVATQKEVGELSLSDLVSSFISRRMRGAVALNRSKLEEVFIGIGHAQSDEDITPPLFHVSLKNASTISIADRRFALFLKRMVAEEFKEWLLELTPEYPPSARRRAHISRELPVREAKTLTAKAIAMAEEKAKTREKSRASNGENRGQEEDEGEGEDEAPEDQPEEE